MVRRMLPALGLACVCLAACLAIGVERPGAEEGGAVNAREVEQAFRTLRRAVRGDMDVAPMSIERMRKILERLEARSLMQSEASALAADWMGEHLIFLVQDNGDLIFRWRSDVPGWTLDVANAWNAGQVLGMAYIDAAGHPTLEAPLIAELEPTTHQVEATLGRFLLAVRLFKTNLEATRTPAKPEGE